MAKLNRLLILTAAASLAACSSDKSAPAAPDAPAAAEAPAAAPAETSAPAPAPAAQPESKFGRPPPEGTIATVFGRGTFSPVDQRKMSYTVDINFTKSGDVSGAMEFSMFEDGDKLDISADVTCGHYDLENGRVWVGGVIDVNRSTKESYQAERYGTGQPIWFRFVESQSHPTPPTRMSPPSFAGDEYDTAEAFCEARPWLAGDGGLYEISADSAVIVFALPEAAANQ